MKKENGVRLNPKVLDISTNSFEQFKAIEQQYR
jgi:hypothetical protein